MTTALRVELRKTLTTRMWWVLTTVMALYVLVVSGFISVSFAVTGQSGAPGLPVGPSLDDPTVRLALYTLAMPLAYVFPLLVGTLAITSEYRYQTLTYTFLAEPRRTTVLVAKLVVGTGFGLLLGLVGVLAGAAATLTVLAATGNEVGLDGVVVRALGQTVLGMGLWAALGVGVGALVRNQVAAIVVVVAFSQLVEPLLRLGLGAWEATRELSQYLPGAAGDAMAGASLFTVGTPVQLLEWWQGGLVLAAYAAALLALGGATAVRRDVA